MTNKFVPGQMYKDHEGREYMFVGYAHNASPDSRAVFTYGLYLTGRWEDGKGSDRTYDIVSTKDVWVNIYASAGATTGVRCPVSTYSSEEEAASRGPDLNGYLFSQKITVTV